ncbi:MAG TPA: hypothetical protein VER14_04525, partial [Phototrophicaceae bacterium]|nr:hypothetical protein [Phototrophicaceae bacterium]
LVLESINHSIQIIDFVFCFVSGVFRIQKNIFIIMRKLVMPMMMMKSRLIFMIMTKIMSAEASTGMSFYFRYRNIIQSKSLEF